MIINLALNYKDSQRIVLIVLRRIVLYWYIFVSEIKETFKAGTYYFYLHV
jgi:hypothetical protein